MISTYDCGKTECLYEQIVKQINTKMVDAYAVDGICFGYDVMVKEQLTDILVAILNNDSPTDDYRSCEELREFFLEWTTASGAGETHHFSLEILEEQTRPKKEVR